MQLRPETTADFARVHEILCAAFPSPEEADLVDRLRDLASPNISIVAEEQGKILGHIFFSPVTLDADPDLFLMGLAPMAVDPAHQHRGIGSALVRDGLAQCRELGAAGVVVLGHADYYPRFGFRPASQLGLRSEYPVPDEIFMAQELAPDALASVTGLIRYHPAFAGL